MIKIVWKYCKQPPRLLWKGAVTPKGVTEDSNITMHIAPHTMSRVKQSHPKPNVSTFLPIQGTKE